MKVDFSRVELYLVTDEGLSAGRSNLEVIEAAVRGGVDLVQYRDKRATAREYYERGKALLALCRRFGVPLLFNDHADIAALLGADGIHLGQDDLPVQEARRLLGPDACLGVSTHDRVEACAAIAAGADYINIGPVFPTMTKDLPLAKVGIGLALVTEIVKMSPLPVTTMGGIGLANATQVIAAGADRVAVVTALTKAPDIAAAARTLKDAVRQAKLERTALDGPLGSRA
ncbi:MAG: thiamine phosphate synthase [Fibrobacterota bacterium]|jgi:thiamine-phosphate diphosphorylase